MYNAAQDKYVSLISSLPSPERLFQAKQTPVSRLKLEQRLRVLDPHERHVLTVIENAMDWRRLDDAEDDKEVLERTRKAIDVVQHQTLRKIIRDRLEIRTILKALRLRAKGMNTAPPRPWGFGRWCQHIERNWNEPGFRLQHAFAWINEAEKLLTSHQPKALETLLLERVYNGLVRHSGQHQFDFEAVVIYVLKWNIINRRLKYNSMAAERRFKHMVNQGVANATKSKGKQAHG